jgi:ferredoxin-NADP reductase/uncharacterized protein YcbX
MSPARVTRIARYPVKGFPGHSLPSAELTPGGVPLDRVCGLLNGVVAAGDGKGWITSLAFLRLARNAELGRCTVSVRESAPDAAGPRPGERPGRGTEPEHGGGPAALVVGAPDGRTAEIPLGPDGYPDPAALAAVNTELADWFPAGPLGPVTLTGAGARLWDWPEAAVSLINLESLADLAAVSGRPVDPRRFRANLHLSGLGAWEEFALLGHRIRVGEAELEVVRTTERCRATTVRPGTGTRDLNVPVLLAARYGHLCCGVYARVVRPGRITAGDTLTDLGPVPGPAAVPDPGWPRRAELVARTPESPTVSSFTFRDPAGVLCRPGQHLRVHFTDGREPPLWRSYTITGSTPDTLRISIKRVADGRVSPRVHALVPGDSVLISGPYGDELTGSDGERPLLLATAGIGITPVLPLLRRLADSPDRPVTVLHVTRTADETPLWDEVTELLARLPRASHRLHVTAPEPGRALPPGAIAGRPSDADLGELAAGGDAEAYLCGPDGFVRSVRRALTAAGVPDEAITDELFLSPGDVPLEERPPPEPGPFPVTFTGTGAAATWTADDGTLLDLAESAGLDLPSGCRSGGCGTCRRRVTGPVHYLIPPAMPLPDGQVLICCAVPVGEVSVRT